jgi:hypothetical protein
MPRPPDRPRARSAPLRAGRAAHACAAHALATLVLAARAAAAQPVGSRHDSARAVQPERPTIATHAGTVARGYAELETGVERDRLGGGAHEVTVPTMLKFGLARRVQLNVYVPESGQTGAAFGVGDVMAGVKWRIAEHHPLFGDVAVMPWLKLPTGGGERGTHTTDAMLLLISSYALGPAAVDVNVGATRRSGDGTRAPRTATLWTASAGVPVAGRLAWAVECYGYPGTAGPAGERPVVALLTGPVLTVARTVALDLGVIAPVAGPQPRAVYAGLTTNFGRLPGVAGARPR